MKTTILSQLARTCGLAAALLLVAGSLVSMTAADIPSGKGAAKLLMKPASPSTTSAQSATMSCPRCTDKYATSRDVSARGANKPLTFVAQHQCGGCSTVINTVGVGKSKQNVAVHTCASGGAQIANCCAKN